MILRLRKRISSLDKILLGGKTIHEVNARFGSSIAAYFYFARFLACLNFSLALLSFTLVVAPMATSIDYSHTKNSFVLSDLFDGRGFFGETWLFYGNYTAKIGNNYDMALVYVTVLLLALWGSLIILIQRLFKAGKHLEFKRQLSGQTPTATETFSLWDYSIVDNKGVVEQHQSLSTLFRDMLGDIEGQQQRQSRRLTNVGTQNCPWILFTAHDKSIKDLCSSGIGMAIVVVYGNFLCCNHLFLNRMPTGKITYRYCILHLVD
jgi:hypothetical protein